MQINLGSFFLDLRSETCVGGKHSKICLTGMAAANATGDELTMLPTYLEDTEIKIKSGWIAYCSKNVYKKWIENLKKRRRE